MFFDKRRHTNRAGVYTVRRNMVVYKVVVVNGQWKVTSAIIPAGATLVVTEGHYSYTLHRETRKYRCDRMIFPIDCTSIGCGCANRDKHLAHHVSHSMDFCGKRCLETNVNVACHYGLYFFLSKRVAQRYRETPW